jgi:hypothetical protein
MLWRRTALANILMYSRVSQHQHHDNETDKRYATGHLNSISTVRLSMLESLLLIHYKQLIRYRH